MISPRILIAGIGNIFLGDDAFGSEVSRLLVRRSLPEGVRVIDFGIRGIDLTYALLDGYEAVVLVDAVGRGSPPGTLHVLELDTNGSEQTNITIDPHALDPNRLLRVAASMGSPTRRVLLVGCEPENCDEGMELTPVVRAALAEAADIAETLATKLLAEAGEKPVGVAAQQN